ncbi:MAG TPA: hypothetical protein VIA80_01930 [Hyphomonadaceae bacterium]|jgi:hypothetical protein
MRRPIEERVLKVLAAVPEGLSAPELRRRLGSKLSQPTLWRCLNALRLRGDLVVDGRARATRYRAAVQRNSTMSKRRSFERYEAPVNQQVSFGGVREEAAHPVQIEGFRRMTPVEKLRMVADLYRTGIQLKVAGLRMRHPDWTEARLLHEARLSLLHAGT